MKNWLSMRKSAAGWKASFSAALQCQDSLLELAVQLTTHPPSGQTFITLALDPIVMESAGTEQR